MKYYFDGVIVVEGKDDEAFLSSFINSIYVRTSGYVIPDEEIDFLNHLENKRIIVLTDSDAAGETIRDRLNKSLINPINIRLDLDQCNKNNKHGVAESNKEEVLKKMHTCLKNDVTDSQNVTLADLISIGITDKEDKLYICKKLHLGLCNTKTLIKRINFKNITLEQIQKEMEERYGD